MTERKAKNGKEKQSKAKELAQIRKKEKRAKSEREVIEAKA